MKKKSVILYFFLLTAGFVFSQMILGIPKTLLPLDLMKEIIFESSGESALQTEILLTGVNRNRPVYYSIDPHYGGSDHVSFLDRETGFLEGQQAADL